MPTPKPKSSNDLPSTELSSRPSNSPASEKPRSPSNSAENERFTENQGPLAERERLPDWLLEDRHATSEDPTGSATSSETSPPPSEESTNVWKPWSDEMVVPDELVPLFLRTNVSVVMQMLDQEMGEIAQMIEATPETEEMLQYTLRLSHAALNLSQIVLYGQILKHPNEPTELLVPDTSLVGPNGERLRKGPDA